MMIMYKLCETRARLVRMVPVDTMVGDAVYIVTGNALPFILRPNATFQNKFQVLGGCYIHGIIIGEVVRCDEWREEDTILQ